MTGAQLKWLNQKENNGEREDLLMHVIEKSTTVMAAGMAGSRSSNDFLDRMKKAG